MAQEQTDQPQPDEANIVSQYGAVEIDWPRTIGFYGGLGIAVATEMVAPPLAIFIAVVPFLKMLNRPKAPRGVQIAAQVLEGAAKPINGDSEGTIRINSDSLPKPKIPARAARARKTPAAT